MRKASTAERMMHHMLWRIPEWENVMFKRPGIRGWRPSSIPNLPSEWLPERTVTYEEVERAYVVAHHQHPEEEIPPLPELSAVAAIVDALEDDQSPEQAWQAGHGHGLSDDVLRDICDEIADVIERNEGTVLLCLTGHLPSGCELRFHL